MSQLILSPGDSPEAGTVEAMQHEFVQNAAQSPLAPASSVGQDKAPAEGAPAVAASPYSLNIPAQLQDSIPPEQWEEFTDFARNAGLNNDQAQAALDFKIRLENEAFASQRQQVAQWEHSVRADPELGGKHLDTTIATATRAMQHYDPQGNIAKLLSASGHGSNPEVVRFLYKVGASLGEDRVPFTRNPGSSEASLGERMYPNFRF